MGANAALVAGGFTAAGVKLGSLAASTQPWLYAPIFATFQSAGTAGLSWVSTGIIGISGGVAGGRVTGWFTS